MAIVNLITMGDTNVNIHHIISTKDSVDDFIKEWKRYGSDIKVSCSSSVNAFW